MAEIPSRLISNTKRPLDLQAPTCPSSILGHKIDRQKPFRERKVRIVKDRAARYRELIATLVAVVLVDDPSTRETLLDWQRGQVTPLGQRKLGQLRVL